MPKETTHCDSEPFVRLEDGNEHAVSSPAVPDVHSLPILNRGISVRWGRNGFVEIGVHEFEIATGQITGGHFSTFSRDGINRLIRSLRKARDAAYGADA